MGTPQQLLNAAGTYLRMCKYGHQDIPSNQLSLPASFSLFTPYFTNLFQSCDFSWTAYNFPSILC